MIQKLAEHRIAFLLLVILLLIQSFSINLNDPYRKPINGDAQGYYAYLPAIFIYQDLDYGFVPEMQQKYYVAASSKSFLKEVDGEKVNKTFPGVTVLYAPFFLLAHVSSLALGLPADGYAYTYQLFYLIGFWFYALLGFIFFRKVLLELQFSQGIADISLAIIVFGTNIFFYTLYDQSVTHIYNFFLINTALFLLLKLRAKFELRNWVLFLSILALIGITRPTNILVIGLFLFFIPEPGFYRTLMKESFRLKTIFKSIIFPVIILAIPLILWKLQTGHWIVYSYGEEGFDFTHPELFNFLFSYTKGWFVYTPVMLFTLVIGFIVLFRQNRTQSLIGIIFIFACVYVYSSWWCWYYGAGMSQRVMIDFYILPGFLIALILQKMGAKFQSVGTRLIASLPIVLLMVLNTAQAYQISNGILPFGSPSKQQYWDNFLVLDKRAQVYPADHWAFVNKGSVSLNPADGQLIKGESIYQDDSWLIWVNDQAEYSATAQIPAQGFKKGCKLIVSFDARSQNGTEKARVVFQIGANLQKVFLPQEYISDEWQKMQYLIEIPEEIYTPVDIYLWNAGSQEHLELRDLSWEIYFSEEYF